MKKTNKSLTDSILLSKGVPQIHKKLMPWRRNVYILLTIEIVTSIIYFSLEIFFTIKEDADNDFFIWLILSVVFNVLLELYEWSVLNYVEQAKLRCVLRLYSYIYFATHNVFIDII